MRRLAATFLLLVGLGGFAVFAGGASDGDGNARSYTVELDNAFGLIEGADLKIAGVRAGSITEMELDRRTNRALVGIEVTETGFGSLRTDVQCESRPQSTIGEYFLDCLPGTAASELPEGARIPVEQTGSTIAPDLVNNILRRPYRERLSIIVNELGAGVAGNAGNLNAAVKRAAPALRETDRVLKILADQNQILADLVKNADTVIGDLSGNRKDVGRWVVEARDTAAASAERKDDIAEGFRRLPGFLRELRPAMAGLGRVAGEQTPALRDLNASADQLERLFGNLGPFAEASRPAFDAFGDAAEKGVGAMKKAGEPIAELKRFAKGAPELSKNLAIILEHLDDRDFAVEADPRSPGGKGYTGLEALLAYVYDQVLSINVFDSTQHYLKVSVFSGRCANYADIERVKNTPGLEEECAARIGPNAPGINFPDPTKSADTRRAVRHQTDRTGPVDVDETPPAFRKPDTGAAPKVTTPRVPELRLPEILPGVELPPIKIGGLGVQDQLDSEASKRKAQSRLLDFLLGG